MKSQFNLKFNCRRRHLFILSSPSLEIDVSDRIVLNRSATYVRGTQFPTWRCKPSQRTTRTAAQCDKYYQGQVGADSHEEVGGVHVRGRERLPLRACAWAARRRWEPGPGSIPPLAGTACRPWGHGTGPADWWRSKRRISRTSQNSKCDATRAGVIRDGAVTFPILFFIGDANDVLIH